MKYTVVFTEKSKKQLSKLDKSTAKFITSWLMKNLQGCDYPWKSGKGLTSNRSGQWRYRIGDYRVIADIQVNKVVILVLEIGHRSNIYKDK